MAAEKGTFTHGQIAEVLLCNLRWSYSAINAKTKLNMHGIQIFVELLFYNSGALKMPTMSMLHQCDPRKLQENCSANFGKKQCFTNYCGIASCSVNC